MLLFLFRECLQTESENLLEREVQNYRWSWRGPQHQLLWQWWGVYLRIGYGQHTLLPSSESGQQGVSNVGFLAIKKQRRKKTPWVSARCGVFWVCVTNTKTTSATPGVPVTYVAPDWHAPKVEQWICASWFLASPFHCLTNTPNQWQSQCPLRCSSLLWEEAPRGRLPTNAPFQGCHLDWLPIIWGFLPQIMQPN